MKETRQELGILSDLHYRIMNRINDKDVNHKVLFARR